MMDKKNIQKLKAIHGEIKRYSAEDDHLYTLCKTPNAATFQSYLERYEDDVYEALIYLFDACVLTDETYESDFKLSVANSIAKDVKMASHFSIDPTPQEDEFKKSAALIRQAFLVNPYELPITEYYKLLEEALWLQKHQNTQLEAVYLNAFAKIHSN
ncbi:hypothetical protein [uncultured Dokdonia sp.]|uniref:hypothetical protein n=1 Tax=uncultured Dokdonia sp. TaxID=575653 RepID=UPI0026234FD7|nr:hypothetical protein [uncultured Dokdonia sp.]